MKGWLCWPVLCFIGYVPTRNNADKRKSYLLHASLVTVFVFQFLVCCHVSHMYNCFYWSHVLNAWSPIMSQWQGLRSVQFPIFWVRMPMAIFVFYRIGSNCYKSFLSFHISIVWSYFSGLIKAFSCHCLKLFLWVNQSLRDCLFHPTSVATHNFIYIK